MTREQYKSLQLVQLKELAKSRGLKHISTLKKDELIDRMLEEDARESEEKETAEPEEAQAAENEKPEEEMKPHQPLPVSRNYSRGQENTRTYSYGRNQENVRSFSPNRNRGQENFSYERNDRNQEYTQERSGEEAQNKERPAPDFSQLDSGQIASGILEVMTDGFGFIRSDNYMPGDNDVYVSPSQIRRFGLKTGDIVSGNTRIKTPQEKFCALMYVQSVNGLPSYIASRRQNFEDMTPIFPNERLRMEREGNHMAMRIVDLVSPVGKGQRGMIVSPPKAGKTTLLKEMAQSILQNNPEMHIIILLIDERPEEVTDIRESIVGDHVEVIYSTFDEQPEHHKRVA